MQVGRVAACFDHALENSERIVVAFQHAITRPQHEQIFEVVLFAGLERLEGSDSGCEIIQHEMANAFQVARLEIAGVEGEDLSKVRRGHLELVFTEVGKAEIEANTVNVRCKSFGFEKSLDGLIEPAGTEIDDAEVAI